MATVSDAARRTAVTDLVEWGSDRRAAQRLVWIYGIFGIALYLLTTSKWGSYLPIAKPPYITDMVLGAIILHRVLFGRPRTTIRSSGDGTLVAPLVGALVFWCAIELARGSFSLTALRDFTPYFYSVCVFLVAAPPEWAKARMSRMIDVAIVFHGVWVSLALAVPSLYQQLPLLAGQINLLGPRNDFDGAVCGLFAAYSLHRALSGRRILINAGFAGGNIVLMLYLKERAGLLAFFCSLVIVAWLTTERRQPARRHRSKALVPILILSLPLLYLVGSKAPAYQRGLAAAHSFVPFIHASPAYANDTATERVRQEAWAQIIRWQNESIRRETVGVGFGPDFMHSSGADILLNGGVDVRSPHNYFVGTWARVGLIGLGIVSAIVLCGLWLAVLLKRHALVLSDVDVLAMLVVVGIPAAAAVGVILESPFGAVPYFWALGHLRARLIQMKARNTCGAAGRGSRAPVGSN